MRRRAYVRGAAVLLGLLFALAAAVILLQGGRENRPAGLAIPAEITGPDPLSFAEGRTAAYERAAAFGLSHALLTKSPGGVAASARRTAAFRSLIEEAVSGSGFAADLVEGVVFLESAGRPDVIAGHDPEHAAGLTQILAETATNFLGMPVDLQASRRLTQGIEDARRRGDRAAAKRLRAERRRVDARFDPARALAGTVRYLTEARRWFGRDDLAVASYHMGIGNLESVLRAYSGNAKDPIEKVVDEEDLDYARIYFDSSPIRHRPAWERLASFGDDSQTYYWRLLAAVEIMRLFRADAGELERLELLHHRGLSSELALHPPGVRPRFATPDDLEAAMRDRTMLPVSSESLNQRFTVDMRRQRIVAGLGHDPALYWTLRPRALDALRYIAAKVYELSGEERPLTVTSAAYDEASSAALTPPDVERATHASLHPTGYSFDVRRRYGSGAQAGAFQWTLERLQALGLIAWARGEAVIHVTVSPRAAMRVPSRG